MKCLKCGSEMEFNRECHRWECGCGFMCTPESGYARSQLVLKGDTYAKQQQGGFVSKKGLAYLHAGDLIMPRCLLCSLNLKKEKIFYQDEYFLVLRTKYLKGHRERFMIVSKEHIHDITPIAFESALDIVERIGKKVFKGLGKFIIMDSTFATINQHWHLVCTDLNPFSDDFEQILTTKWLRVIDC